MHGDVAWCLTGVYGWPNRQEKRHTWGLIDRLNDDAHDGWLCVGDFNQVVNLEDKEGGRGVDYGLMIEFREVLEKCDLQELSFVGNRFTWDNGREGEEFI